jgi:tetratricopeptide (TPR) repeat protein
MEFWVILDSHPPHGLLFQIANDRVDITIDEIISSFEQRITSTVFPEFSRRDYEIYLWNQSDPFVGILPSKIMDTAISISDVSQARFDLYLSRQAPLFPSPFIGSLTRPTADSEIDDRIRGGLDRIEKSDYREAFDIFTQLSTAHPLDPRPVQYLVTIFTRLKLYASAHSHLSSAISRFPASVELHILHGYLDYKCRDYPAAIEKLQRVRSLGKCTPRQTDQIDLYIAQSLIKMKTFFRAEELLRSIVATTPSNAKAVFLLAKIHIAKGDVGLALSLVMETEQYRPNHKYVRRFIGSDLSTPVLVHLTRFEWADALHDSRTVFFFAKALFDVGRCDASAAFFHRASALDPASPSFLAGMVAMETARRAPAAVVVKALQTFLMNARDRAHFMLREYAGALLLLNPRALISGWARDGPRVPAGDFRPIEFAQVESSFSSDELTVMAAVLRIHIYLFSEGYLQLCAELSAQIVRLLSAYAFPRTIINRLAVLSLPIMAHLPTIPLPLPDEPPFIYAFGGDAVIPIAYKKLTVKGQSFFVRPVVIPCLTFASFETRSAEKFAFVRALSDIPRGSFVLICLATNDLEILAANGRQYTPELYPIDEIAKKSIQTFFDAIDTIDGYVFIVHPLVPPPLYIEEFKVFNRAVEDAAAKTQNAFFLPFQRELLTPDGAALRPEMANPGMRPCPLVLNLIEQAMNSHERLKPPDLSQISCPGLE